MRIKVNKQIAFYNFAISTILLVVAMGYSDCFVEWSRSIVLIYFLTSLFYSLVPKEIFFSWPVIIIRISGFVRFVVIPFVMYEARTGLVSYRYSWVFLLEIVTQVLAIMLYSLNEFRNKEDRIIEEEKCSFYQEPIRGGFAVTIVILLVGIYLFFNRGILRSFFSLSLTRASSASNSGFLAIMISVFFLIMYLYSLKIIYKMPCKADWVKIGLCILASLIYINGSAISATNVSRWALVIGVFVSYTYLQKFFPEKKGTLTAVLIVGLMISIFLGSLIKDLVVQNAYGVTSSFEYSTLFSYKSLNAYFSGPTNIETGMIAIKSLRMNVFEKSRMFVNDIFKNFPFLNRYIVIQSKTSTAVFNQLIYGNGNVNDQIIPLSCQLYNYFGVLFVIPELSIIYISMMLYKRIRVEKNYLNLYCYVCMCVVTSLVNCIHMTIMFQYLWIQVLPIIILNKANLRINKS